MKTQKGYIAIASILVITVVVLIIGTTVALLSVNDIQSSLSNKKSEEARDLVEGCAEDTLLQLNQTNTIPTSITIPEGSCSVTINSHTGNDWTFTVSGQFEAYQKTIQISATRNTTVVVTRWNDI